MTQQEIEEYVEEIMRMYHMKNYDDYLSEELREKYRKIVIEEEERKHQ